MARDSTGPKGEPEYDGSGGLDTAADGTELGKYAALVGNRKTGTHSQRTALSGSAVWDGLEFFETDTRDAFVYDAGSGGWSPSLVVQSTESNGFFSPASGWTNSGGSQYFTPVGPLGQFYASFVRSGGAIAVPASGDVGNVVVGSIGPDPVQLFTVSSGKAGRLASFAIDADGTVTLTAVAGSGSIETGDGLSFGGLAAFR